MREIVTIQLGGCGNNIGEALWDVISSEHGIDPAGKFYGNSPLQLERINVFFNEDIMKNFHARAVCADTDKASLYQIRSRVYGRLFNPENMVFGSEGTWGNFAKGHYTEGAAIMDDLLNAIRREAEAVDCLQGFLITHSIGGGTGSGMAALLFQNIATEYPESIVNSFTVIPSPKVSNSVVEPYNAVLTFPQLIASTHQTFCIDNEALHDICIKNLQLPASSFNDMNHIIAHTISGVTTGFRFPGQLNSNLRKLFVNMTPFQNLHFFVSGFAPLTSCHKVPYRKLSVPELVMQIFSGRNLLADIDLRKGKFLTAAAIYRGLMSTKEVDVLMRNIQLKNKDNFIPWIPNSIKTAICDIPPKGLKLSATFVANTTSIRYLFNRPYKAFQAMLRRKAHLHWYTGEGMEEAEFEEAGRAVADLMKEYQNYENLTENEDRIIEETQEAQMRSLCMACNY